MGKICLILIHTIYDEAGILGWPFLGFVSVFGILLLLLPVESTGMISTHYIHSAYIHNMLPFKLYGFSIIIPSHFLTTGLRVLSLPGVSTSCTYPKIWCTPLQNHLPTSLLNCILEKSCTSKHRASSAGIRWDDTINHHKHSKPLQLHCISHKALHCISHKALHCISHKALQLHVHAHVNTDHDAD